MAYLFPHNHDLEAQYQAEMCYRIQYWAAIRAKLGISQQVMADTLNRSLRTIQRFEHYQPTDMGYLLFAYKKILAPLRTPSSPTKHSTSPPK